MDARVNFITLAVADLAATRRFYSEGLGWEPELEAPGVVMIRLAPTLVLSLWAIEEFETELRRTVPTRSLLACSGHVPTRIAHPYRGARREDELRWGSGSSITISLRSDPHAGHRQTLHRSSPRNSICQGTDRTARGLTNPANYPVVSTDGRRWWQLTMWIKLTPDLQERRMPRLRQPGR